MTPKKIVRYQHRYLLKKKLARLKETGEGRRPAESLTAATIRIMRSARRRAANT
jgi:hypothetical protein